MLIVEIYVNHELIGKETAVRIVGTNKKASVNTYRLSDGTQIQHTYGDGAARLAEMMMKHLAEKRRHD